MKLEGTGEPKKHLWHTYELSCTCPTGDMVANAMLIPGWKLDARSKHHCCLGQKGFLTPLPPRWGTKCFPGPGRSYTFQSLDWEVFHVIGKRDYIKVAQNFISVRHLDMTNNIILYHIIHIINRLNWSFWIIHAFSWIWLPKKPLRLL